MGALRDAWRGIVGNAETEAEKEAAAGSQHAQKILDENEKRRRQTAKKQLLERKPSGPYTAAEQNLLAEEAES